MGDEQHREPPAAPRVEHHVHHLPRRWVESSSPVTSSASSRSGSLASATPTDARCASPLRELVRAMVHPPGPRPSSLEELHSPRRGAPVSARQLDRQLDVLDRREERDEVAALEHEADPAAPAARPARLSSIVARSRPSKATRPELGRSNPAITPSRVVFPLPETPVKAGGLAAVQLQVAPVQHPGLDLTVPVGLGHVPHLDQGRGARGTAGRSESLRRGGVAEDVAGLGSGVLVERHGLGAQLGQALRRLAA